MVAGTLVGVRNRAGSASYYARCQPSFSLVTTRARRGSMGHRFASVAIASLSVAACAAPLAPNLESLTGRWVAGPDPLLPRGNWIREFIVFPDGRTENRITNRGTRASLAPTDTSSMQVLHGRIRVFGSAFLVSPDSEVTRDLANDRDQRFVRTENLYWWVTDTVRFQVTASALTVRYLSYPADAPVPTKATYRRNR